MKLQANRMLFNLDIKLSRFSSESSFICENLEMALFWEAGKPMQTQLQNVTLVNKEGKAKLSKILIDKSTSDVDFQLDFVLST